MPQGNPTSGQWWPIHDYSQRKTLANCTDRTGGMGNA